MPAVFFLSHAVVSFDEFAVWWRASASKSAICMFRKINSENERIKNIVTLWYLWRRYRSRA